MACWTVGDTFGGDPLNVVVEGVAVNSVQAPSSSGRVRRLMTRKSLCAGIRHPPILPDPPRLDTVVVVDGLCAADGDKLLLGGLDVAGLIGRPAHQHHFQR